MEACRIALEGRPMQLVIPSDSQSLYLEVSGHQTLQIEASRIALKGRPMQLVIPSDSKSLCLEVFGSQRF